MNRSHTARLFDKALSKVADVRIPLGNEEAKTYAVSLEDSGGGPRLFVYAFEHEGEDGVAVFLEGRYPEEHDNGPQ